MLTEAHLFSMPNDCLWYDKLWGPSQRVVTLFVFEHDDVPEPRPSDAAQQRLHRVTAAVEGHRHLDPTNWPDDLSFRLPAGNWDDFNCFCRNLFLVNLTSIQKSDVEGAAGQFSIVSDC